MATVNPETNEVVDDLSKTTELRIAAISAQRENHRMMADIISTLEDKAWVRGWIIGITTGICATTIVLALWNLLS
jgi:hypothetical protein